MGLLSKEFFFRNLSKEKKELITNIKPTQEEIGGLNPKSKNRLDFLLNVERKDIKKQEKY